jgi:hypothetical protein
MNFAIDLVDTLLKGWEHFRSLGPLCARSMLLSIVLCSTSAFSKSIRFHSAFAVFNFIYNVAAARQ